jgi:hypothetical protein
MDLKLRDVEDKNFNFQCGCGHAHSVHDTYAVCDLRDASSALMACPHDDKMITLIYLKKGFTGKVKDVITIASYKDNTFDEVYGKIFAFQRMEVKGLQTLREYSVALNKFGDRIAIGQPEDAGVNKISRAHVYDLPEYPLLALSAFEAYKATTLWSDGVLTEALFESPFYLPDGSYGSQSGAINFRKFTTSGEYTILYNTFYYKNSLNSERVLQEPYNITFVVS